MHMPKAVMAAMALLMLGAVPAHSSDNARVVACFKEVNVPAKYSVKKVRVKEAERKYVRRDGLVLLLEYPAVYREDKTLVEPAHVLMREVKCRNKSLHPARKGWVWCVKTL